MKTFTLPMKLICLGIILQICITAETYAYSNSPQRPLGVLDGSAIVKVGTPEFEITKLNPNGIGAKGGLKVGDRMIAAGGKKFEEYDNNIMSGGKGGPQGLGNALDEALGTGTLKVTVMRGGTELKLKIAVPRWGSLSDQWPMDDSERVQVFREAVCEHINKIASAGRRTGYGGASDDFSRAAQGLALLASGNPSYKKTIKNIADRFAASSDSGSNWRCFQVGVFMAEYYLSTKDDSVLEWMQRTVELLESRMNEKGYIGHGGAYPAAMYGHKAGFNPVQSGSLWFMALAQRCGIKIDETLWDANATSLERSSGGNGAVGYSMWARGGGDAHDRSSKTLLGLTIAQKKKKVRNNIGMYLENSPGSMRESHAVSAPGVMDTFLAAYMHDQNLYHKLLNQWKWFFTLAEGPDHIGLYIGGKRNNGGDTYLKQDFIFNAMLGVVLSAPKQALYVYGGMPNIPGVSPGALSPELLSIVKSYRTQKPVRTLSRIRSIVTSHPRGDNAKAAVLIGRFIFNEQVNPYWKEVLEVNATGDLYETKKQYSQFVIDCGYPPPIKKEMHFMESILESPRGRKIIKRGEIYHQLIADWVARPYSRPFFTRKFEYLAKDTSDVYGKKAANATAMLEEQERKKKEQESMSEEELSASRNEGLNSEEELSTTKNTEDEAKDNPDDSRKAAM